MAGAARWGLKRATERTVEHWQSWLNGRGGPLGFETNPYIAFLFFPFFRLNGRGGPLGFETNRIMYVAGQTV